MLPSQPKRVCSSLCGPSFAGTTLSAESPERLNSSASRLSRRADQALIWKTADSSHRLPSALTTQAYGVLNASTRRSTFWGSSTSTLRRPPFLQRSAGRNDRRPTQCAAPQWLSRVDNASAHTHHTMFACVLVHMHMRMQTYGMEYVCIKFPWFPAAAALPHPDKCDQEMRPLLLQPDETATHTDVCRCFRASAHTQGKGNIATGTESRCRNDGARRARPARQAK
mmetsp:Transcript_10391/g.29352  ORF Transcript_10391/g.29352 Transcript_10391/m.29352 type:complete len:225 (+) Transcript_10391:578-1252(+)